MAFSETFLESIIGWAKTDKVFVLSVLRYLKSKGSIFVLPLLGFVCYP